MFNPGQYVFNLSGYAYATESVSEVKLRLRLWLLLMAARP